MVHNFLFTNGMWVWYNKFIGCNFDAEKARRIYAASFLSVDVVRKPYNDA